MSAFQLPPPQACKVFSLAYLTVINFIYKIVHNWVIYAPLCSAYYFKHKCGLLELFPSFRSWPHRWPPSHASLSDWPTHGKSCHTFQQVPQSRQSATTTSTLRNLLGLQCRQDTITSIWCGNFGIQAASLSCTYKGGSKYWEWGGYCAY